MPLHLNLLVTWMVGFAWIMIWGIASVCHSNGMHRYAVITMLIWLALGSLVLLTGLWGVW